jgi:tetratricopeptide (TPR) repeat protein
MEPPLANAFSDPDPSPRPPAAQRPWRRRVWLGFSISFAVLGLLAGFWAFHTLSRDDSPPEIASARSFADPRLTYAGPFRNVRPNVRYVGDARCVKCHRKKAETFARHPMGRSLVPIARLAPHQPYDHQHHNPFRALGTEFRVERRGKKVRHRQIRRDPAGHLLYELDLEARFAIGSGTHGHSYLAVRDGFLFQTPISWFSQASKWDLSPGFTPHQLTGRPVDKGCLFCHANRALYREDTVNGYQQPIFDGYAIGCERCHGPGELHIHNAHYLKAGEVDETIVNPGKLPPALREAVCEQCHLEGAARVVRRGRGLYDFRPGMPLEDFWSVFVYGSEGGADRKAVNHVEQMYQSQCFRQSSEDHKLGCISCHDPHVHVGRAERVAHYRKSCLECHEQHGCSLPRAQRLKETPQDSCIQCHMTRYASSDIAHTASTDHRILRRRPPAGANEHSAEDTELVFLEDFFQGRPGRPKKELARDLGIAWVHLLAGTRSHSPRTAEQAIARLEGSVRDFPDDIEAWEAKAVALSVRGRLAEALAAYQTVLVRRPQREKSLVGAAQLAQDLGRAEEALGYWGRAAAVNPWMPGYRRGLALLLAQKNAWKEVRFPCRAWLRLDPGSVEARRLWAKYLSQTGRKAEARAEQAKIEVLDSH